MDRGDAIWQRTRRRALRARSIAGRRLELVGGAFENRA
jgi:hypothetical protein